MPIAQLEMPDQSTWSIRSVDPGYPPVLCGRPLKALLAQHDAFLPIAARRLAIQRGVGVLQPTQRGFVSVELKQFKGLGSVAQSRAAGHELCLLHALVGL